MRISIVLHRSDCDVKRVTCHYRGCNANCFGLSSPIVTEDNVLHSFELCTEKAVGWLSYTTIDGSVNIVLFFLWIDVKRVIKKIDTK